MNHLSRILLLSLLALTASCQSDYMDPLTTGNDAVQDDGPNREYARFLEAQSVAGARHDAMLYDCHFNGDQLSSLGCQKLALMSQVGENDFPVVVYLASSAEVHADARAASVRRYLKDKGLQDTQIDIRAGDNPDVTFPADQGLANLTKQDAQTLTTSSTASAYSNGTGSTPPPTAPTAGDQH